MHAPNSGRFTGDAATRELGPSPCLPYPILLDCRMPRLRCRMTKEVQMRDVYSANLTMVGVDEYCVNSKDRGLRQIWITKSLEIFFEHKQPLL